jgi:hypothetical protein
MREKPRSKAGLLIGRTGQAARRRRDDRAHFERVGAIYTAAYRTRGGAPTRAVAEEMKVSRSAAGKWVARARELELLDKTEPRKAGGVKEER